MAQQVEHVLGKDEVTGSSPVSSSIKVFPFGKTFLHRLSHPAQTRPFFGKGFIFKMPRVPFLARAAYFLFQN